VQQMSHLPGYCGNMVSTAMPAILRFRWRVPIDHVGSYLDRRVLSQLQRLQPRGYSLKVSLLRAEVFDLRFQHRNLQLPLF